ncbi:MAG: DUF2127 domain-containing protein [Paludisphaera borealis]|uniref:DUF2127 domain-containing protein n=1 Tax=Paludisphaera borealis TaxID=1387353 RepID=UPI0028511641|nr:DUF2127 domain-containing protein [Paludisphaera borealis]MDR3622812.1 DUF2127 domain-containing protein [Paludisphaera borealis]
MPSTPTPSRSPLGLKLIGVGKLASGVLALAVGFGLFRLFHSDVAVTLEAWISRLRFDPDNRLIHEAVTRVANIQPDHRRLIEAGAFFYGTLHMVEGFGLVRGKNWGAFLTIIATSSLIPLEVFEISRKPSAVRILVLIVNAALAAYLIHYEVRHRRNAGPTPPAQP